MRRHDLPRGQSRVLTRVLVALVVAFALAAAGSTAAFADDLPPPIVPPGVTPPPDTSGNDVPPGPTYVITPGTGGTELGEPADQRQIDEARKALSRAPGAAEVPTDTTKKAPGTSVAGPKAPAGPQAAQGPGTQLVAAAPLDRWWLIGSGLLLLLVLLELARAASQRPRFRAE